MKKWSYFQRNRLNLNPILLRLSQMVTIKYRSEKIIKLNQGLHFKDLYYLEVWEFSHLSVAWTKLTICLHPCHRWCVLNSILRLTFHTALNQGCMASMLHQESYQTRIFTAITITRVFLVRSRGLYRSLTIYLRLKECVKSLTFTRIWSEMVTIF